ncbi:flagellar assembly protein FliH [Salipaludibacillus sp. HK11]|uniref:flagellar assembly protein FliH n=1 Tax=Salipaludibacillus sp. HK11 TaxID=3394320 RepID=UPI0039FCB525
MSRLIKSPYTNQPEFGNRTIKLRTIEKPARNETAATHEDGLGEIDEETRNAIQYKEHERMIESEKENIEYLKQEFQTEVEEWQAQLEEQKKQIEMEAEVRFNQAAEEGYNQGYQDGVTQVNQEYSNYINQAKETVENSKFDYHSKLSESAPVMLELAMTVAEKIIGDTLLEQDSAWLNLVKDAVTEVREHEEVKIYIHPAWYETTLQQKKELQAIALHTRELLIFPDESMNENDCIIETPFGQIDASVDSQLRELKRVLVEKLAEGVTDEH